MTDLRTRGIFSRRVEHCGRWIAKRFCCSPAGGGSWCKSRIPKSAAGVSHHSQFHEDPLGRLQRTTNALWSIIFDEPLAAQQSLDGVKKVHGRVHGEIEPAEPLPAGTRYDAFDEELLLWVHATLIDSAIRSYQLFV